MKICVSVDAKNWHSAEIKAKNTGSSLADAVIAHYIGSATAEAS